MEKYMAEWNSESLFRLHHLNDIMEYELKSETTK